MIHADIDPAEISKNRIADVPIVGDVGEVIKDLIEQVTLDRAGADDDTDAWDYTDWRERVADWKRTFPLGWTDSDDGTLSPQYVIERIGALTGPEATYVAGVGQHQMWAAQFVKYERPNAWINSGGLGTMGFSVPAAMGAKVAEPERTVWAIDGDGCFQMTNQEPRDLRHQQHPDQGRDHQQQARSAWSGSGRRSSTTSATPTPTCSR